MARYFFDVLDGEIACRDDEGTELPNLYVARQEALTTLCQIAKDDLPDGPSREFRIEIRDGIRPQPILTASLVLKVEEAAGGTGAGFGLVRQPPSASD